MQHKDSHPCLFQSKNTRKFWDEFGGVTDQEVKLTLAAKGECLRDSDELSRGELKDVE